MVLSAEEIRTRGHPVWAEIDLGAIRDNVRTLRSAAASAQFMGVVKGYAYGHGNPQSARAMIEAGAARLGVARLAEGIHLRESGIEVPIHLFTEPPPGAVAALIENQLTATVYTGDFARALSEYAERLDIRVPVHVKLDTGMHRVGILADDVPDALLELRSLPGLEIEGVWSHLAVADVPDHPHTRKQLDLFAELLDRIERTGLSIPYRHIANSAATLSLPQSHYDLVRCGIAAYGLSPGRAFEVGFDLKPAMALRARVAMVKTVPAGDALSYGLAYELDRAGGVVTIGSGYADGYDRRLSGRADVLIAGRRFKVSGTICMDQFMVDVGDESVDPGAIVTLIGRDGAAAITAEELAGLIGTINYEVTARVPSRVPRLYLGEVGRESA
ncbi:MAG: alanine racemase [Actinomycetota bacterium]